MAFDAIADAIFSSIADVSIKENPTIAKFIIKLKITSAIAALFTPAISFISFHPIQAA
jgi:hypothetical protein